MIDLLGDHGANHGHVVRHFRVVGKVVGDILPGLTILLELGGVAEDFELLSLKLGDGLALGEGLGHGFAIELIELGFVVEGLEMRRTAGHAEKDDAFCLGRMVREAGETFVVGADSLGLHELRQERGGAEGHSCVVEESAPFDEVLMWVDHGHDE